MAKHVCLGDLYGAPATLAVKVRMRPSPIPPKANPQQRDTITTDGPGSSTTCTRVERVVARITAPQGRAAQSLVGTFPTTAAQDLTTRRQGTVTRGDRCAQPYGRSPRLRASDALPGVALRRGDPQQVSG